MEQRVLGRTGLQVGAIGLGTEYLLKQPAEVMAEVVSTAALAGASYVDLLYGGPVFWDDFGPVVRRWREHFVVAAHWGSGEVNGQLTNVRQQDDCARFFDATLAQLGNDYAEVGMLMMVDQVELWDTWAQESLERLARYRKQGRIGAIGMSGHKAEAALKAVESGEIDVLMYPVHLASGDVTGNRQLFEACQLHDVAVVAMKPYAGGKLLQRESSVLLHWVLAGGQAVEVEKAGPITPLQCLHYVLSQPVATVVPGVRDAAELRAALDYFTAGEREKDFGAVIRNIEHYPPGVCIYCNHCLPCPQGIDVGQSIRLLDEAQGGLTDALLQAYADLEAKPSACVECGECSDRCPYEVDVAAKLQAVVAVYEAEAT